MRIKHTLGDLEVPSEQRSNGRRVVALDGKAAALRWSVETEGRNYRGPTGFERPAQMRNVRIAMLSRGEEMENGAIVPDVNRRHLPVAGHIGLNPPDLGGSRSESRARAYEGG